MKMLLKSAVLVFAFAVLLTSCGSNGGDGSGVIAQPPTPGIRELFLSNLNSGGYWEVSVFDAGSNGDVKPIRKFRDPTVPFSNNHIAADTINNEIFVANRTSSIMGDDSITIYSREANGITSPLRTITGEATLLSAPYGIAIDTVNNEILIPNAVSNIITVYSRTANGNVSPLRSFWGNYPFSPSSIAVDAANDEILVSTAGGILAFPRLSTGKSTPLRTISASAGASYIAVDNVHDEIYLITRYYRISPGTMDAITVYSRTADGAVTPLRRISGELTGLRAPEGIAIDTINDEIFVSNSLHGSITVYSRTADGNIAPLRTITGTSAGISYFEGIALALQ